MLNTVIIRHGWKRWLALLLVWVALYAVSEAADHTLSLTADQETALLYALEQENAKRAQQKDADGQPLPAFTPTQMLVQIVAADLTNVQRNLDAVITPVLDNLKALDATTQAKVLATVPSAATKQRVQQRLAAP